MAGPIIPLLASIVSGILGKKKEKDGVYAMESKYGNLGDLASKRRVWSDDQGKFIDEPPPIEGPQQNSEPVGSIRPGQIREVAENGGYQNANSGNKFGNAVGKIQTIGSIVGSLGKKDDLNVPYQMQMRRRY